MAQKICDPFKRNWPLMVTSCFLTPHSEQLSLGPLLSIKSKLNQNQKSNKFSGHSRSNIFNFFLKFSIWIAITWPFKIWTRPKIPKSLYILKENFTKLGEHRQPMIPKKHANLYGACAIGVTITFIKVIQL